MGFSIPRSAIVESIWAPPRGILRPLAAFWRLHRLGAIGGALVALFFLAGLAAPILMPHDPNQIDVQAALRPPSRKYPLGTDNLGRDLASRIIFGARVSLYISVTAVALGLAVGTAMGMAAAYYRGSTRRSCG